MSDGHCVYRAFNKAGDLLYVGQTGDLEARLRNHRYVQPWWTEVDRVESIPYWPKEAAVKAERVAIRTEGPRHNVQLLPGRRMVPLSFRVPAEIKDQGYERAEREGRNPTEVMRELWTAWAKGEPPTPQQ